MTRINVVPVEELCDQHLLAEWRELTRIPNGILAGKLKYDLEKIPKEYTLGKGHMYFFVNKLQYLYSRYDEILIECALRKFNVMSHWKPGARGQHLWSDYIPTDKALSINRIRIEERMPTKPRYYGK